MSKHNVSFDLSWMELGERGINVEVFSKQERIGNLKILEEGVEYYGNHWNEVVKLSWSEFDEMLEQRKKS